jgi:hypothetical protein
MFHSIKILLVEIIQLNPFFPNIELLLEDASLPEGWLSYMSEAKRRRYSRII